RGLCRLALESLGQQDALDRVQPAVPPRLDVFTEVLLKQPTVHERLVFLVGQVGPYYGLEESRIFLQEEEVQLMAGVFRVLRTLLFRFELRPIEKKRELGEIGVMGESRIE